MFPATLDITYDGAAVTLNRISDSTLQSDYFAQTADSRFDLSFRHTKGNGSNDKDSHVVRLDVSSYDTATSAFLRKASAWTVIKTQGSPQDQDASENVSNALVSLLTTANITKVVGFES